MTLEYKPDHQKVQRNCDAIHWHGGDVTSHPDGKHRIQQPHLQQIVAQVSGSKSDAFLHCCLCLECENRCEQEVCNETDSIANGICYACIHRLLQYEVEQIVDSRGDDADKGKTHKLSDGLPRIKFSYV